jgi:hypothetical protein
VMARLSNFVLFIPKHPHGDLRYHSASVTFYGVALG